MSREAKFPKGEKMTLDEVAAVVGEEFKQMNENPPESVVKVREEMEGKTAGARQRLTWDRTAGKKSDEQVETVAEEIAEEAAEVAADVAEQMVGDDPKKASGLYGYTKAVQRSAESAARKLARSALRVAKRAFARDAEVVPFLQAHVKREGSKSAKVLLAALKEIGPKVASEMRGGRPKEAGAAEYGLYGFKAKTADLGLDACKEVRSTAGRISADLHLRRMDHHEKITGFLKEHSKKGRCAYANLLFSCYPDAGAKVASTRMFLAGIPVIGSDGSTTLEGVRVREGCLVAQAGKLTDVEPLPLEMGAFRDQAHALAAKAGVSSEKVAFTKIVHTATLLGDASGFDVDGEMKVLASWGTDGQVWDTLGYTASFEPSGTLKAALSPSPKSASHPPTSVRGWIEWED